MPDESGNASIETGAESSQQRLSRRRFLRSGSAVLATAAGAAGIGTELAANATGTPSPTTGGAPTAAVDTRFAMVIDTDRCIGCNACAVACKAENGVRLGGFRSWVAAEEVGTYPTVTRIFLPRLCNHCEKPACLKVCPVGATYKRVDGLVDVDKSRCIGCRYCMVACPYGVRYFNPRRDAEGAKLFPARTRGTVDKCNFCAHRVDHGVVPACVNTCPTGARVFGDLNDPGSDVHRRVQDGQTVRLLEEFGTGPSVFYTGGRPELFEKSNRHGGVRRLEPRSTTS